VENKESVVVVPNYVIQARSNSRNYSKPATVWAQPTLCQQNTKTEHW